MKHLAFVMIGALGVHPLFADVEILPIDGVDCLNYDIKTGKVTPAGPTTRYGAPLWSCGWEYVNYFWGAEPFRGEAGLDWGDIDGPAIVGGIGFTEFTNSQAADGDLYAIIAIYAEENGWDSAGRVLAAAYVVNNIPGSEHPPNEYWGFIWGVDLGTSFVLDGSDLDADGLVDWGYFQFFSGRTPGCLHGPAICGLIDPNNMPPEAPGVEWPFDLFINPSWNSDPGDFDGNNIEAAFVGTYWFDWAPIQFYFMLHAPQCPNRGDAGRYCHADIDGSFDCIVGLTDLAVLLSNYGLTTGAHWRDGDVDPYDPYFPGDGDVDLADLAELLMQYGDDCTGP
jgi:hypothetical protein